MISDPSCTWLVDDRAKFPVKNEMCLKFCPVMNISTIVLFRLQVVERSSLVSVLFREAFSYLYISFFSFTNI